MKIIKTTKSQYSKIKSIRLNSPFFTRIIFGSVILLLFKLIFGMDIKLILFLILAAVFNSLLQTFQLARGLPTDFELSTFTTVMVTAVFGLKWGIFNAIFSKMVACIYTGSIVADHFFMIATYINAAILTSLFGSSNLLVLGFIIVMINSILMFTISKNILGIDITANLSYTGTNFIFNALTFSIFTEIVHGLLRI